MYRSSLPWFEIQSKNDTQFPPKSAILLSPHEEGLSKKVGYATISDRCRDPSTWKANDPAADSLLFNTENADTPPPQGQRASVKGAGIEIKHPVDVPVERTVGVPEDHAIHSVKDPFHTPLPPERGSPAMYKSDAFP